MSNKVDITIPKPSVYNGDGANRPVDCVCGCDMISIWRPGASSKVGCKGRRGEGRNYSMFELEIVDRIVCSSIRWWRSKSEELDRPVIASSRKVFVRGVESNAFDMTLMY